jgi:SAM-dependent methyltransferase
VAEQAIDVTAVDPAAASLAVARRKPGAERVTWIHGDATALPHLDADLAVMTANVAQVVLSDDDFTSTLSAIGAALRSGGILAFEVRDPSRRAWESWHGRERNQPTEAEGHVTELTEVTGVVDELVSFRHTYSFGNGDTVVSDSTLRFRERAHVEGLLGATGFGDIEIRDAPDRPGAEWVFVARGHTPAMPTAATDQTGRR